jgi:hypothetical protein
VQRHAHGADHEERRGDRDRQCDDGEFARVRAR